MTQAIFTRFLAPTNTRGARVKAYSYGWSVIVPYDYQLGGDAAHDAAAKALAEKCGWKGAWVSGGNPEGDGNAYVQARNEPPAFVL